jgi:hypothetical protein
VALADTRAAIGAVGELLRSQLTARTAAAAVDVGRPEASVLAAGPKFNLFLYQVEIDAHLRQHPLDQGQLPPLWLVLHYLLMAVDDTRESDSTDSHSLLGEGMLALQELNFLRPPATSVALTDNPEPLKITFDQGDAELLSKVMQGTDERYRVSIPFQIRPVMIAPGEPPSYALPVLTVGPADDEGVTVIPSIGACLTSIEPESFEAGDELSFTGIGLSSALSLICFGDTCIPVTAAPAGELRAVVPVDTTLSAGSYAITAARETPGGRRITSNAVLGHLLPTVMGAVHGPLTDDGTGNFFGVLTINGIRLGGPDDSIFVAFYADGEIVRLLEPTGTANQIALNVNVDIDDALPPRDYRIVLRVNGVQAPHAPDVDWLP